ncbi:GGDEF domain-containing protein [Salinisphaera aquimarina]|uniref:diguanylate cyclase n=1 Tax=Salinisphaera aquimarina TaxID=2094031 RepID=A0ABV7EQ15_9GAMM
MPRHRDQALRDAQQLERSRAAPWTIGAIRRQLDYGFRWLRFEPALEREFEHDLNRSARANRIALLAMAALTILLAPVFDTVVFDLPVAANTKIRLVQYAGMLPVLVLAIVACARGVSARLAEAIMTIQFVAIVAGLMGVRVLLMEQGVDFPVEFTAVGFVGIVALGRVRSRIIIPVGVLTALLVIAIEVWGIRPPHAAYYHLAAAGTLVLIAAYLQYTSEYSMRGAWLDQRLLELVSRRDGLTGLLNRHALESSLTVAHAHAVREGLGYGLAMIDIDQFGRYNNGYGHPAGDQTLREVAQMVESYARRPLDVCGRYGGEEFTALWIGESGDRLEAHAENLRAAVQALHMEHKRSTVGPWVTVSVGLCYVSAPDENDSLSAVLATADRLLYKAKRQGRNRVATGSFESLPRPALTGNL